MVAIILLSWNVIGLIVIVSWAIHKPRKVLMIGDIVLLCAYLPVFIVFLIFMTFKIAVSKLWNKIQNIMTKEIKINS